MSVEEAARVFGSPLRIHLIRYYRAHPGTQKDAAEHLTIARTVVHDHTQLLVSLGVVDQAVGADKRSPTFRVNEDRLLELWQALRDFGLPAPQQ